MPTAFVLIGVETGTEHDVIRELRAIDNVKDVYFVFGVYDIVAKVEAKTEHQLKLTITYKIRSLEKIRSTQTLMTSE
jgi:DNA-binding Lrp family transcriptional regulator